MSIQHARRTQLLLFVFLVLSGITLFSIIYTLPRASADQQIIDENTLWEEEQTLSGEITVRGHAQIDFEQYVAIAPGSTLTFESGASLFVIGTLDIRGTMQNPVTVKGAEEYNGYGIMSAGPGVVRARNAIISDGGFHAVLVRAKLWDFLIPVANASSKHGAITSIGGGTIDVAHSTFENNLIAISSDNAPLGNIQVWASIFRQNSLHHIYALGRGDFRYNYWGPDGPDPLKNSGKIVGIVQTDYWSDTEEMRDPVVILPGILGSWRWTASSDLELDPILHTYDDMVNLFKENGYVEGETLFPFPYEWRLSNEVTANMLREKLEDVREQAQWPLVDVVAHSMGGLAARQYIASDAYADDIDQLVTLGTPHAGSPQSYLIWEGGDFGFKLKDKLLQFIFTQESKENGYNSVFDYVRGAPIASVGELLPTYSYLKSAESGEMLAYPDNHPQNAFLDYLNTSEIQESLKQVEFTNITGHLPENSTLTSVRVESPDEEEGLRMWEHGKPEGYDDLLGDHGLEFGAGDGTVPVQSSESISPDAHKELESSHTELPSDAAETVFETLTGENPIPLSTLSDRIRSIFIASVYSPVDIQVTDTDGNILIGKNFETGEIINNTEGGFYTGWDGILSEFITIPNPPEGGYTVKTQGVDGGGDYRVETALVTQPDILAETQVSTVEFSGTTEDGGTEEYTAVIEDGEIREEKTDTEAPVIEIIVPEEGNQVRNTGKLSLEYFVTDDTSAPEDITVETSFDGKLIGEDGIDLAYVHLGQHTVGVKAIDEAGNGAETEVSFMLVTDLAALKNNLDQYEKEGDINRRQKVRIYRLCHRLDRIIDRMEKITQRNPSSHNISKRWMRFVSDRAKKAVQIMERYIDRETNRGHISATVSELLKESCREILER